MHICRLGQPQELSAAGCEGRASESSSYVPWRVTQRLWGSGGSIAVRVLQTVSCGAPAGDYWNALNMMDKCSASMRKRSDSALLTDTRERRYRAFFSAAFAGLSKYVDLELSQVAPPT